MMGDSYADVRRQIVKIEKILIISVIIGFSLYWSVWLTKDIIAQFENCDNNESKRDGVKQPQAWIIFDISDNILKVLFQVLWVILIIVEVTLFTLLIRSMKSSLNRFYLK